MRKADGLNKRPDWKIGTEKDNNNQILIKEEWVKEIIEIIVEELETILVEKIKRVKGKDCYGNYLSQRTNDLTNK